MTHQYHILEEPPRFRWVTYRHGSGNRQRQRYRLGLPWTYSVFVSIRHSWHLHALGVRPEPLTFGPTTFSLTPVLAMIPLPNFAPTGSVCTGWTRTPTTPAAWLAHVWSNTTFYPDVMGYLHDNATWLALAKRSADWLRAWEQLSLEEVAQLPWPLRIALPYLQLPGEAIDEPLGGVAVDRPGDTVMS